MHASRRFVISLVVGIALAALGERADAAGPRNPYSSFNLSGINYGAQQWDRAQREGRRVWPYYNTPVRNGSPGSGASVGGIAGAGGGAFIQGGSSRRTAPRNMRRSRR